MQNQERKNRVSIGNINQMFRQELVKDKYVRVAIYFGAGVLGLFSIGYIFKALNFAACNIKALNNTLKK
jgi:hypothetical protein